MGFRAVSCVFQTFFVRVVEQNASRFATPRFRVRSFSSENARRRPLWGAYADDRSSPGCRSSVRSVGLLYLAVLRPPAHHTDVGEHYRVAYGVSVTQSTGCPESLRPLYWQQGVSKDRDAHPPPGADNRPDGGAVLGERKRKHSPRVVLHVILEYPDGFFFDEMDGTDEANAMERARNRWPHAEIYKLAVTGMDGRLL